MIDEDFKVQDSPEYQAEMNARFDAVDLFLKTLLSVHKDHNLGVEFLMSAFEDMGVHDAEKVLSARFHACCEWDV